jgi:hypothetical protein
MAVVDTSIVKRALLEIALIEWVLLEIALVECVLVVITIGIVMKHSLQLCNLPLLR